jgi:hypothetical protein
MKGYFNRTAGAAPWRVMASKGRRKVAGLDGFIKKNYDLDECWHLAGIRESTMNIVGAQQGLSTVQQTKKIYIATTFREFDDSANDEIQRVFLSSLQNQSYKNWQLVVTVFHEKTVKNVVRSIIPDAIIMKTDAVGYKFSLTDVLLNAIRVASNDKKSVIMWTTCDVVFENNFLENIIRNYSRSFSGTSHPHMIYSNLEDLKNINNNFIYKYTEGIDTVFFSTNILASARVTGIIEKYKFVNWGCFEHFLVGIAMRYSDRRINLRDISCILKIINDREANNESKEYFEECININLPVLYDFFSSEKIPHTFAHRLDECNAQFTIVKKGP